jgi:hypothetical protein
VPDQLALHVLALVVPVSVLLAVAALIWAFSDGRKTKL